MSSQFLNKLIVFTDLDGTLLDEHTYSTESSLQALKELQASGVRIVFCSSKTRNEQEVIRKALGVHDPFIVENGSAIIVPPNTDMIPQSYSEEEDGTRILVIGLSSVEIRATLKQVTASTGIAFKSFQDLSIEEIAQITGLDLASAGLAKSREFSETIVTRFSVSEQATFVNACELRGLQCIMGGRFLSVTGCRANKGRAVQLLTNTYRLALGDIVTIGIGDSLNDAPMLREVDIPYIVQRPNGKWMDLEGIPSLNRLPAVGPLGFAEMVNDINRRWFNQE